jgi:hypothetical protein
MRASRLLLSAERDYSRVILAWLGAGMKIGTKGRSAESKFQRRSERCWTNGSTRGVLEKIGLRIL